MSNMAEQPADASALESGLGASGHIADVKRGEYHRPSPTQRLKEISDLERFYHEATRIRRDLDVLLRDLAAAIGPARDRSSGDPVYISPITGKRHKIGRAK